MFGFPPPPRSAPRHGKRFFFRGGVIDSRAHCGFFGDLPQALWPCPISLPLLLPLPHVLPTSCPTWGTYAAPCPRPRPAGGVSSRTRTEFQTEDVRTSSLAPARPLTDLNESRGTEKFFFNVLVYSRIRRILHIQTTRKTRKTNVTN